MFPSWNFFEVDLMFVVAALFTVVVCFCCCCFLFSFAGLRSFSNCCCFCGILVADLSCSFFFCLFDFFLRKYLSKRGKKHSRKNISFYRLYCLFLNEYLCV